MNQNEREEALRLMEQAGFTGIDRCSVMDLRDKCAELIRLARTQPQGEPPPHWGEKFYAFPPAQAVPEGWKLGPLTPTEAMKASVMKAQRARWNMEDACGMKRSGLTDTEIYQAMLSAAPQPEVKDE